MVSRVCGLSDHATVGGVNKRFVQKRTRSDRNTMSDFNMFYENRAPIAGVSKPSPYTTCLQQISRTLPREPLRFSRLRRARQRMNSIPPVSYTHLTLPTKA